MIVSHNTGVPRRGYSVREVAEMIGVTPRTVYKLVASGEVRSFRIGRAIRVRAEDVDRIAVTGTGD
jgi:excisionase family DNA binding protein